MSGEESGDELELEFRQWASILGLSDANVKKLEASLVTDLNVLLELREIDIESMKIGIGDGIHLRTGVAKLRDIYSKPPHLVDDKGQVFKKPADEVKQRPVGERMYTLAEVEKLVAGKSAILAGASSLDTKSGDKSSALVSLATLFSKPATGTAELRDVMRELLGLDDQPMLNAKGEKCLLPINFLSCVRGTQNSEEVIHSGKGVNLVVQSALRKTSSPDKLSIGQWTAANSRILSKLIVTGRLCGPEVLDYLEYVRKIGDLLQLYTPGSVFQLDHNHRLELHESTTKRRWQDIDCTLENAHLKRRDETGHTLSSVLYKPNMSQSQTDRRGTGYWRRGVCWAFNSAEGCSFSRDKCRYEHVESVDRSARSNGFQERAPHFQTNTDRTVSKP
jgi:hypothetical protein